MVGKLKRTGKEMRTGPDIILMTILKVSFSLQFKDIYQMYVGQARVQHDCTHRRQYRNGPV